MMLHGSYTCLLCMSFSAFAVRVVGSYRLIRVGGEHVVRRRLSESLQLSAFCWASCRPCAPAQSSDETVEIWDGPPLPSTYHLQWWPGRKKSMILAFFMCYHRWYWEMIWTRLLRVCWQGSTLQWHQLEKAHGGQTLGNLCHVLVFLERSKKKVGRRSNYYLRWACFQIGLQFELFLKQGQLKHCVSSKTTCTWFVDVIADAGLIGCKASWGQGEFCFDRRHCVTW